MQKLLRALRKAELLLTGALFVTALCVLTVNVFFRRIPQFPALDWAEEYMRYCSIWITFIGMAVCAEDDLHVGVDIVYQMSATPVKKVLKIICMLAACIFCAMFTVASAKYVMMAMGNMQRSAVMRVPLWIVYLALPIGSALSTFQYLLKSIYFVLIDHRQLADNDKEDADDINLLDLN